MTVDYPVQPDMTDKVISDKVCPQDDCGGYLTEPFPQVPDDPQYVEACTKCTWFTLT